MIDTFLRSSIRYLFRHLLQIFLSVIGVAVGVAVVIGIDLSIESAIKGFNISVDRVTGNATHQIMGSQQTVEQELYGIIRIIPEIQRSAPVIEKYVSAPEFDNRTLKLMGVDPLAEGSFRPYFGSPGDNFEVILKSFMGYKNGIWVSKSFANQLNLALGDTLQIRSNQGLSDLKIVGMIQSSDEHGKELLNNLLLADISTVQEVVGMNGKLSHIDLILPDGDDREDILKAIKNILPAGIEIRRSQSESSAVKNMLHAFTVNLSALSFLALIVGMFLIYNTMTFSVLQRRSHIGRLQALGVTQNEIFTLILSESLLVGIAGTILGGLGGIFLGKGLIHLVTRTINDLYFVLNVNDVYLTSLTFAKGIGLGIGATILTAIAPAREATHSSPRISLNRSQLESKTRENAPKYALSGVFIFCAGILILLIPSDNVLLGYAGLLPVIMGFAFLTPAGIIFLTKFTRPLCRKVFGLTGSMANQSIVTQLSRTSVAIAALGIAVSATLGVTTSVQSFRGSVEQWLKTTLQADIYISSPGLVSRRNYQLMDREILEHVKKVPGVTNVSSSRFFSERINNTIIDIGMMNIGQLGYQRYKFKAGDPGQIWPEWSRSDAVIVNEPYALRYNINIGDRVELPTERGQKRFKVAGIYYDYGSDIGTVLVSKNTYDTYWSGDDITAIALYAGRNVSIDTLMHRLRNSLNKGEQQSVLIRSNKDLREASLEVFDRTFTVTRVLQVLTIIVALIGVLSALMALQMERIREIGVLRAIGLTPAQIRSMIFTQTGLMGAFAGILATPLGIVLAVILIFVVNQRSFGWTLQLVIHPWSLIFAVLLSVFAALIASVYPAYKMSSIEISEALRQE